MPGTYIHPDTTRRFTQRHRINNERTNNGSRLPSLFFDSSVAVTIHDEADESTASSELLNTDGTPFCFYVAGVGDLALVPCPENQDNATVVRVHDRKSPCRNTKLSLLFAVPNAPEVHVEAVVNDANLKQNYDCLSDRIMCSLRKVLMDSLCSGYAFGVVGSFIDCFLTQCLSISTLAQAPLTTRLVFGFLSGFIIGNLLRPMVGWTRALVQPLFNRLGQLPVFTATRNGYLPLFWSEDLPEFIGFMMGAPIAEFYRDELGAWKGFVRSAIGSGIGSALGEVYRHCSQYFRRATTAEIVLDRLLEELREKRGKANYSKRHFDVSMGFMLGCGVFFGQILWYLINLRVGRSLRCDVLGQAVNYLCIIMAYEIAKRCPGEPCNSAMRSAKKLVRSWSKESDLSGLFSQQAVDRLVKNTTI